MTPSELLLNAFDNVAGAVDRAVDGLTPEQLAHRPAPEANTIAWLVWHLTRVQDDHVADAAGSEQVWTSGGWAARFALPLDDAETGYGATPDEVAAVRADAELLTGYHAAVHARTAEVLRGLSAEDLDRVVDERWDPPVSYGVRLVSVVSDDLQHAGQAGYLRGLLS